jgi:fatty acid desaturase
VISERVEVLHGGFSAVRPDVKHEEGESVRDLTGEMGRERLALRCKTTLVVLLCVSASLCLILAFVSLVGYLPYAVGPAVALLVASEIGFVASILEARYL